VRNVTGQLKAYLGDLSALPDAECAAALWLAQMRAFATAIAALPYARSLDAEDFFGAPRDFVALAAGHLEVPMTAVGNRSPGRWPALFDLLEKPRASLRQCGADGTARRAGGCDRTGDRAGAELGRGAKRGRIRDRKDRRGQA